MKARYLLIGALVTSGIAILALRSNAFTAIRLRDQVLAADQASQDVKAPLEALHDYVFAHMNSSTKFTLIDSYNRAVSAAQRRVVSGKVYAQAQAACDQPGVGSIAQAQCVQEYLAGRLVNVSSIHLPAVSQFTYNFAAPGWSGDLAGWSLLVTLLLALVALVVYVIYLLKTRSE